MKKRNHRLVALALLGAMAIFGMEGASASPSRALNENSANKVYSVKVGSHLSLTLHSMYWSLSKEPATSGITEVGSVIAKPILPGPNAPAGCKLPGIGCGTQTWNFVAKKAGTYQIAATRTSCGEALQCTGSQGSYAVTIRVKK